ncbi:MAG: DNA-deoxyinosine glycosylase [Corallococcus sp.]|nr:DNA-deoxyinosine glycosylase [Corallococcus sp.]
MKQFVKGLPPVFDKNSNVLILGSFPSVKSRAEGFFYGNAQNRFWKILSARYGRNLNCIEDKKQLLCDTGIALWDIVDSCNIEGFQDSSISDVTPADLSEVLGNCNIKIIYCNGQTSYKLTQKYYGNLTVPTVCLPSTSPANVSFDVVKWNDALNYIDDLRKR